MFRVFTCVSAEHDWRLVLLAGFICFSASLVAVSIFRRAIASQLATRLVWIAIAGAAIGYGIWATHFIAMLAYDPGIPVGYSIALTAISLVVAMMLTSIGFGLAASTIGRWRASCGGAVIGAGIASMHYLGMWALEVPGQMSWSPDLVVASIFLGMVFGYCALAVMLSRRDTRGTLAGAILLTLAIVSHHFTAMGAVEVLPGPRGPIDASSLSPGFLALAIAGVALSVLGMSFVGVLADRRLATRTRRFEEIIHQLSQAQQQVQRSNREAQEQKSRLDAAINNMGEGLCMFDAEKQLVVCNARYAEMYQLPPDLLKPGAPHHEIISHRVANGILKDESDAKRLLSTLRTLPADASSSRVDEFADGRLICVTRHPTTGGGWVATHRDVTEQRRSEAKIEYLANHDVLTGLASRAAFTCAIEAAKSSFRKDGAAFCVLLLDLDRFKRINDTLGHSAGDALLKDVASRLLGVVTKGDLVARLGGDEFAILQFVMSAGDETEHHNDPLALASSILKAINRPFVIEGNAVCVGTSIGIAVAPTDGHDPDELLKNADIALYKAKSKGRNTYSVFNLDMMAETTELLKLEADIRLGLERAEFELHYQPFVDVDSREVVGAEALLRWRHPELGLIPPNRFIPLAESSGLIHVLGEFVLQQASEDAARWPSAMKVAVNLSPVQFREPRLVDIIERSLAEAGLPARRLEVEVTESVLLENEPEYVKLLRKLQDCGVSVALDDFGTGYSSLSYLKQFPFNKIKIDQSFVRDVRSDQASMTIVSSIVGLARALDMITIAEGIETADQLEMMRAAGVTLAQGYLLGRPRPVSELVCAPQKAELLRTG